MQKKSNQLALLGLALAVMVTTQQGCTGPGKATGTAPTAAPATGIIEGKVVETMDAGGYTYLRVESQGKNLWAAVPTTTVSVGQSIRLLNGAEMHNFPSKALNRTFDNIIFSGGVLPEPRQAAAPAAAPAAAEATAETSKKQITKEPDMVLVGKVVETHKAGNYTYICLEKDGKRGWSAVPTATVKVGDEIEVLEGTQMGSFTSKSLKRTFDSIVFSPGIASKN